MKYIALFTVLMSLTACFSKKPELTGKEGKVLPSFNILLSDSSTWVKTQDIKSGRPFVFFLFGPHCSYSKAQMQKFIDNSSKLKNIQLYAITPYPFSQMKEFYTTYNLKNHPNIVTGIDPVNFFGDYLKIKGVPYIVVFDKEKILKKAFIGTTDISVIIESIGS